MTFIETVTHRITGRARVRGSTVPRRAIFIWAAAILFSNQIYSVVKEMPSAPLDEVISNLLSIGIFQYLAWYAVFRLLASSSDLPVARLRDIVATVALCLIIFLPTSRMIWVAAAGIAVYLWAISAGDPKLRAAGLILGALSVQEFWGRVLFHLIAPTLLRAETAVVGTILEFARPGTIWHDNVIRASSGYGIAIVDGCSSFHNLSLAMLSWLTMNRLRHQDWAVRDFMIGGAIGVTMILLNVIRLCFMGWNVDLRDYWHDGPGADIFAVGASLIILLMSLYGSRSVRRLT